MGDEAGQALVLGKYGSDLRGWYTLALKNRVRMLNRFRWLINRSMLNMLRMMKQDWELAGLKSGPWVG